MLYLFTPPILSFDYSLLIWYTNLFIIGSNNKYLWTNYTTLTMKAKAWKFCYDCQCRGFDQKKRGQWYWKYFYYYNTQSVIHNPWGQTSTYKILQLPLISPSITHSKNTAIHWPNKTKLGRSANRKGDIKYSWFY